MLATFLYIYVLLPCVCHTHKRYIFVISHTLSFHHISVVHLHTAVSYPRQCAEFLDLYRLRYPRRHISMSLIFCLTSKL
jgi:hypothetical protein